MGSSVGFRYVEQAGVPVECWIVQQLAAAMPRQTRRNAPAWRSPGERCLESDPFLYAGRGRQITLAEIVMSTKGETMEVNGIAHVFLTASNFERSRAFYRQLLPFLGLKPVMDTESMARLLMTVLPSMGMQLEQVLVVCLR